MKAIVFLFFLMNTGIALSQAHSLGITRARVGEQVDFNKVYHKSTGEKISEKQFNKIVLQNPEFYLDIEYDREGIISKYVYDPEIRSSLVKITAADKAKVGEIFSDFLFTTIKGEKIGLNQLKGKYVIIRFIGYSDNGLPGVDMYKTSEIIELDEKIEKFKNKDDLVALIIFSDDENTLKQTFKYSSKNFIFVPKGQNFIYKFKLNRTPVTLILDKESKVIDWYNYSEDIELEAILK